MGKQVVGHDQTAGPDVVFEPVPCLLVQFFLRVQKDQVPGARERRQEFERIAQMLRDVGRQAAPRQVRLSCFILGRQQFQGRDVAAGLLRGQGQVDRGIADGRADL